MDRNGDASDVHALSLAYYAPSPALQPYVTTFYSLRSGDGALSDTIPAVGCYLLVVLCGSAEVEFADGRVEPAHPASLLVPGNSAAIARMAGPVHLVGATLSPLGWAALTGLPASRHCDRLSDAEAWFPGAARLVAAMQAAVAAGANPGELIAPMADFIASRLKPVNPRHAELIGTVAEWLSSGFDPSLADLSARTTYSARQLERLVERYFAASPRLLARKFRVLRAAALLQDPATTDARTAELLNLFYDQSHMIREMRRFLGSTPARLGGVNSPLLAALTGPRNFREISPNVARMPGD